MLIEAEGLLGQRGFENVRWELGDVQALPYPGDAFDVVACRRAATISPTCRWRWPRCAACCAQAGAW